MSKYFLIKWNKVSREMILFLYISDVYRPLDTFHLALDFITRHKPAAPGWWEKISYEKSNDYLRNERVQFLIHANWSILNWTKFFLSGARLKVQIWRNKKIILTSSCLCMLVYLVNANEFFFRSIQKISTGWWKKLQYPHSKVIKFYDLPKSWLWAQ